MHCTHTAGVVHLQRSQLYSPCMCVKLQVRGRAPPAASCSNATCTMIAIAGHALAHCIDGSLCPCAPCAKPDCHTAGGGCCSPRLYVTGTTVLRAPAARLSRLLHASNCVHHKLPIFCTAAAHLQDAARLACRCYHHMPLHANANGGAGVRASSAPLQAMQMCLDGCQLKTLHITWLSVPACNMYVCGTLSCFCQTC
jgi:hypothetical protein